MRAPLVMLVMVVGLGVAHAGEPSEEQIAAGMAKAQAMMKQAEQAEQAARDTGDHEAFDRCGEAYVAVRDYLRTIGVDDHVPAMTYNAAICFGRGGSAPRALALLVELERGAPRHELVVRARMQAARLRQVMGDLEGAAEDLVFVATRYPGERDAYDALSEAAYLYDALGDRKAMERAAQQWIKLFGRKDPRRAAEVALHLALPRDGHRKPADTIRATHAWLKTYGGKDRLLTARAYLALGEAELAASCPVAVDARGLCLAAPWTPHPPLPPMTYPAPTLVSVPKRKPVALCAPDATPVKVMARDARGVARAQAALERAIHAGEAANDHLGRGAWHVGRAQLALALLSMEAVFADPMPVLKFSVAGAPDPATLRAMSTWLQEWRRKLDKANSALLDRHPRAHAPGAELIAAARASWLGLAAADMLLAAPLPPLPAKVDADEWRNLYCGQLDQVVEPFRARARELAIACVARANDAGIVDDARECLAMYERFAGAAPETLPPAAWGVPTPSRP